MKQKKKQRKPKKYANARRPQKEQREKGAQGRASERREKALFAGTFSASRRGFGFFVPSDELRQTFPEDIFIPAEKTGGAMQGDAVLVFLQKDRFARDAHRVYIAAVAKIIQRAVKTVSGVLCAAPAAESRKAPAFLLQPTDLRIDRTVYVDQAPPSAQSGQLVSLAITSYPDTADAPLHGDVVRIYGDAAARGANYESILEAAGVRTDFPPQAIAYAQQRAQRRVMKKQRLDLRDKIIFTIDSESAKDLDDAVSVERTEQGYLLGVHIADVSEYVAADSCLDEEAYLRGNSIYFVDRVIPMLPQALSNGSCSLNGGVSRYALSALISLDKAGNILSCELHESIIRSAVRGVYSELNDITARGKASPYYRKYAKLFPHVYPTMCELYEILSEKHRRAGALDFDTEESRFVLGEDGEIAKIVPAQRGVAERLIEQFMLCANEAVALWLHARGLPCIYRIHEQPDAARLSDFLQLAREYSLDVSKIDPEHVTPLQLQTLMTRAKERGLSEALDPLLLRCLAKAKYASVSAPHFGLATEYYCHFTSPIRRYSDLCVHRIVKAALRNTKVALSAQKAARIAQQCSECETNAMTVERDIEDLYRVRYMEKFIGQTMQGCVSSVCSFGFFVRAENTCEGIVPIASLAGVWQYEEKRARLFGPGGVIALGQRVTVSVEAADTLRRRVTFSLVGPKTEKAAEVPKTDTARHLGGEERPRQRKNGAKKGRKLR